MDSTKTIASPINVADDSSYASISKKVLMSVTGFVFIGFVTGHMIGNLQLFLGQEQLNKYAETLQHLGGLLWIIRSFLALFFIVHIFFGIKLWFENRSARPISYARTKRLQATVSSRTMIYSGLAVLLYVVYHILHFTLIVTNPEYAGLTDVAGRHDVYSMVILGFQNYMISAVYIVAMFAVAFHVNHALPSLFQTIGWNNPRYKVILERLGTIVAIVLFVGYASMPVAVLLKCVTLPTGGF